MQETIDNSRDSCEVSKAAKGKDKLQKQLKETKDYGAKLAHIALSRIEIYLDDGVKVNYEKVQTGRDGKKMQFARTVVMTISVIAESSILIQAHKQLSSSWETMTRLIR